MGFFDHSKMEQPVQGTALVITVNPWYDTRPGRSGPPPSIEATLVVAADGVPKTTVEYSERVHQMSTDQLERWPSQGDTIPVTIDRSDPARVHIDWARMQSPTDKLRGEQQQRAKQLLAEAYRTEPDTSRSEPGGDGLTSPLSVDPPDDLG